MESRNPNSNYGAISIQLLVIMVPVMFGMMGFALDLGRIYLIKGELNSAAQAMAMAAAEPLNGTLAGTDNVTAAANATIDPANSDSNKYNFGSLIVGQGNALLGSAVASPAFFADAASAITSLPDQGASNADGTSRGTDATFTTAPDPKPGGTGQFDGVRIQPSLFVVRGGRFEARGGRIPYGQKGQAIIGQFAVERQFLPSVYVRVDTNRARLPMLAVHWPA